MSMYRIANYGSFLQAYGLKKLIKGLGHKVKFVDYRVGEPLVTDESMLKTLHEGNLKFTLRYCAKKLLKKPMYFSDLYRVMLLRLGITENMHYNSKVDVLVVGSDEVFNCLQANPDVGFSPELFGKDAKASKLITYAASFGTTTAEGLKEAGKYEEVRDYLSKFSAVSVRDVNSENIAEEMGLNKVTLNLDPVLMYDFTGKIKEKKDVSDYILVYSYAGRMKDEGEISAVREFAKKHNKKIVTVGYHQEWSDIKLEGNPFELLGYFKNADYVVTDTFHGTIFSIITKQRFATIIRESNKQKLVHLLDKLGLSHRTVHNMEMLSHILEEEIDYTKTDEIIRLERERTLDYLTKEI